MYMHMQMHNACMCIDVYILTIPTQAVFRSFKASTEYPR